MHGQFSVKSDVYSFGVLLLEIVSGQKNNCFRHGEHVEDLLSYVSTTVSLYSVSKNAIQTLYVPFIGNFDISMLNTLVGMEKLERPDNFKYCGSSGGTWPGIRYNKMHSHCSFVCPRKCS